MSIASILVIFFLTWWVVLFAVLPWGVRTDPATGQIGAPMLPDLKRKALITTGVSLALTLIIVWLAQNPDFLPFRRMAQQIPL